MNPAVKSVDTFFQDCFYSKQGGPKDCVVVSVTSHGVYGNCMYSNTLRFLASRNGTDKARELGELVGCPQVTLNSKDLNLNCPYYANDEVEIK